MAVCAIGVLFRPIIDGAGIWLDERNQFERLKVLEAENTWLRRAVSYLTLDKMILTEVVRGTSKPCLPPAA